LIVLITHSFPCTGSAAFPHSGHSNVAIGPQDKASSQYFGRPRKEQYGQLTVASTCSISSDESSMAVSLVIAA
jgi:hypothetical protein